MMVNMFKSLGDAWRGAITVLLIWVSVWWFTVMVLGVDSASNLLEFRNVVWPVIIGGVIGLGMGAIPRYSEEK